MADPEFRTSATRRIAEILAPVALPDEIVFDEAERVLFSADLFHRGLPPAAIARPRSTESLARLIGAACRAGIPIVPRGGGISYSAGYVSNRDDALMIDLRAMHAIVRTDSANRTLTVEAGCTWAALDAHLRPLGLRTPYWGPASGRDATIGGTLSQQGVLFGSARFGAAGDHVVAMKIVTADGAILDTRGNAQATPRDFVGDCGILGIKAEITLPLIDRPRGHAYAAFRFADDAGAREALTRTGQLGLACEAFLFDRCWSDRRHGNTPAIEGPAGLPGHRPSAGAALELHAAFEGEDTAQAQHCRARFEETCIAHGGQAEGDGVLGYFHAHPFARPTLMIGPGGRRWIPLHFIVPHASRDTMFAAIDRCIQSHGAAIADHGIEWGWSAMILGRDHLLIEPSLYWADAQPPQVTAYLDADFVAGQPVLPADPAAFAAVNALRNALIAAGTPLGARHLQIGRLYPPNAAFTHWTLAELRARKRRLDPNGLMNPGAFGL